MNRYGLFPTYITAAKSTAQLSAAMKLFDNGTSVNNLKKIGQACIGLSNNQLKLILSTKGLKYEQQKQILLNKGVAESEIDATLATLGFAAAEDKATFSTFSLKGAFRSLGTAIAANPIGMIVTVVTVATMVFTGFNKAMEEARQKAKELGDSFKSTKSEIEDYKSQIEELHKTINDNASSIEDVTNARKTLMSVQDELINKFGTEKSVINNVTDAINGQTDALDRLTNAKWQEVKNEFNDGGFWNNVANFFDGKDNIERMLDEYSEKTILFEWANFADITKLTDEMVAELENIGIDIKVSTDNLQAIRDFDSLTESISDAKGASLSLSGNAEEIYNQLLALQNLIGNDDSLNKLYDKVEYIANSYKDLTDSYKDFYNQYVLYEKILTEGSDYANTFKDITDAYEKYSEAFTSGDESKIKEATENYARILTDATSTAIANSDTDVASYFENMYPALQSVVSGWQFNVAFDANTNGLQNSIQSVLDELKDEDGRSLTTEEILGLGEANEQYQDLVSIAHDYKMSIAEMIDLLKERNMVSAMDYQGLVGLFGQENVDKLSAEDMEIAYTIKNVGNMTFDELQAAIEKTKEIAEEPISPTAISDLINQLNTQLKPTFDSLKSAYQDIFTSDGYNPNAVDISMLDSIKSSLEKINELEDVDITIDMDAFDTLATTLTDINTTEDQARQAFNDFATSIFYATNATNGMTDETKELVEQLLESLGIVNATEVAEYALMEAKLKDVLATHDLAMASAENAEAKVNEFHAILAEGEAAGLTRQQIYNLTATEIAFGNNNLNAEQKIEQLRNLAKAYGDTASAAMATAIANDLASGHTDVDTAINDLMAKMNASVQKVDIDFSGLEKSAAKAGSSAGKSYADALKDELSDLGDIINYVNDVIGDQIDLFEDQKDAAVDALEAEKKAAEEALEAEKALVQEKIDAKQAEIDKIKEAKTERENELDLQEKLYNLARLENQNTALVYTESKGMIYRQNTKEVRSARNAVTEAKENIQIANLEKDISGLNDIIDDLDKKIEESNDYYNTLIEQAKNYWDSLVKGLEDYNSRWKKLTEIEEQSKMTILLRELGITTDDVLNMSESAFQSFKGNYLCILNEMYAGNDDMIRMLQQFGGISTGALAPLSGTISNVADSIDKYVASASNADTSTSKVSESVNSLNANTTELNGNLSGVSDTLDNVLGDNKLETIAEQMSDVAESIQKVSDALSEVPEVDISEPIAQFDALGNSVDNTTAAISGGTVSKAEPSTKISGKKMSDTHNKPGHDSGNLIDSIENIGETTAETLGESGGDGAIGKFEELGGVITDAENHTQGIIDKINDLDGMTAECTIRVNVETVGGVPAFASGTAIGDTLNSMSGNAHVEGTANVTGDWSVQSDENKSLVGEIGRELIVRQGRFFTVGDNGPEMFPIKKGDIVFNHEQTEQLLKNGHVSGRGKAYADGTVGGGRFLASSGMILEHYNPDKDNSSFAKLYKAWTAHYGNINDNVEEIRKTLTQHVTMEHNQQMNEEVNKFINNSSSVVNNRNIQQPVTIQIGDINLTGVQDVNGLSQAIKTRLPGQMMQEYFKN